MDWNTEFNIDIKEVAKEVFRHTPPEVRYRNTRVDKEIKKL